MNSQNRPPYPQVMRSRFVSKSLLTFVLFVLLSVLQFWLILHFATVKNFVKENVLMCLIFFVIGLLHIIIFVFVEGVRRAVGVNWILAILIMECMVFAISRTLIAFTLWELLASVIVVLVVIFLFHVVAAYVPHDFTLDVIILFVLSYILFVAAVYFLTIYLFDKEKTAFYIFCAIVAIVICAFIIYHAQTIIGGRYAEMRLSDYLLAALILYVDFLLLFMISLHFISLIVSEFSKRGIDTSTQTSTNTTTNATTPKSANKNYFGSSTYFIVKRKIYRIVKKKL